VRQHYLVRALEKKHDARVYYSIFPNNCIIYLVSISSQKEHHSDTSDKKIIEEASTQLLDLSRRLNEKPL
jgi:hypothetical protein